MASVAAKLRLRLYFRHFGQCHWCGCDVFLKGGTPGRTLENTATIDHLKTKLQGRSNFTDGGHVLACQPCNNRRGAEDWASHAKKKMLREIFKCYWQGKDCNFLPKSIEPIEENPRPRDTFPIGSNSERAVHSFGMLFQSTSQFYKVVNFLNKNVGYGRENWTTSDQPKKKIKRDGNANVRIYIFKEVGADLIGQIKEVAN